MRSGCRRAIGRCFSCGTYADKTNRSTVVCESFSKTFDLSEVIKLQSIKAASTSSRSHVYSNAPRKQHRPHRGRMFIATYHPSAASTSARSHVYSNALHRTFFFVFFDRCFHSIIALGERISKLSFPQSITEFFTEYH